jgi:hypothetical protein
MDERRVLWRLRPTRESPLAQVEVPAPAVNLGATDVGPADAHDQCTRFRVGNGELLDDDFGPPDKGSQLTHHRVLLLGLSGKRQLEAGDSHAAIPDESAWRCSAIRRRAASMSAS